jgi:hypothetical protein
MDGNPLSYGGDSSASLRAQKASVSCTTQTGAILRMAARGNGHRARNNAQIQRPHAKPIAAATAPSLLLVAPPHAPDSGRRAIAGAQRGIASAIVDRGKE